MVGLKINNRYNNKTTNKVTRLFKAESRTQVSRHLSNSIEINGIDALELADLFASGEVIKVEEVSVDATTTDSTDAAAAVDAVSDTTTTDQA